MRTQRVSWRFYRMRFVPGWVTVAPSSWFDSSSEARYARGSISPQTAADNTGVPHETRKNRVLVPSGPYLFEGRFQSASEIARRCPAYSYPWIGRALKDGCKTIEDLAKRWAKAQAKHRQTSIRRSKEARKVFR